MSDETADLSDGPPRRASPEREQAERLNLMVQSITDYAIFSLDVDGVITSWNPAAEQVFGYPEAEIIGQSFAILFTPEDREAGAPGLELARAAESGSSDDIRWHLRRDGSRIFVNGKVTPIRNGGLHGFTKIAHDVTRQKLLEDELLRANRRKDEFLAMLGHELRNPLNAINAAAQVIGDERDVGEIQWASDAVKRQVRHLSHLLDDLLDAARVTQGKIRLRREVFDASVAITRATEAVRSVVEGHRHELSVTFGPSSMWLDADPTRIEQIVINLLTNAAKYSDDGGRIWLHAGSEGREVVIVVRDAGIGIQPEILPNVFDLFEQADRSLDRAEGGLGIGLSLVRGLTEMHGGTVAARSEGPGRGSEFTVRLPLANSPGPGSRDADPGEPGLPFRRLRVLVVDDNADTAQGMLRLLTRSGHDVRAAGDGLDAIEQAKALAPEVVLLDIGLPGLDGYQVARALRDEIGMADAMIVAISGYGRDQDQKRSREAGFDHHLVKPLDFDVLFTLLASVR